MRHSWLAEGLAASLYWQSWWSPLATLWRTCSVHIAQHSDSCFYRYHILSPIHHCSTIWTYRVIGTSHCHVYPQPASASAISPIFSYLTASELSSSHNQSSSVNLEILWKDSLLLDCEGLACHIADVRPWLGGFMHMKLVLSHLLLCFQEFQQLSKSGNFLTRTMNMWPFFRSPEQLIVSISLNLKILLADDCFTLS